MSWVLPTGANDPDGKWNYEYYAYDGNLNTSADDSIFWPIGWHSFIELTLTDTIICNKVRLAVYRIFNDIDLFDIDVWDTEGEVWVHVFQGDLANSPTWNEKTFSVKSVSKARYRHYGDLTNAWGRLFEFNFWEGLVTHYGAATITGTGTLSAIGEVERAIISPPYINIDVVSVDSDNSGFLDDTDETAMIAAKSEYVRRFDIDFDDDVDEADDTWFDNTRANNPSLSVIRDAIRTSTYQKFVWGDNFTAYLVQLNDIDSAIQAFVGRDTGPVYGWLHGHKHPYTTGDFGVDQYICHEFHIDLVNASYKVLGYGCILGGTSYTHAYGIFWVGGDWTDLYNWRIVEPQNGNVYNAGDGGLGEPYQTLRISFFRETTTDSPWHKIHRARLNVDFAERTVSLGASDNPTVASPIQEEPMPIPYTFDVTLGLSLGKVTLAGVGALVAIGTIFADIFGKATLAGAGTLVTLAATTLASKAILTGASALAAIGRGIFAGATYLSGIGSLSTIGQRITYGIATLTGLGTLVGEGIITAIGKATLAGIGTLVGVGRCIYITEATLAGIGTLAAIGRCICAAKTTLSGTGFLSAIGACILTGISSLSGTGILAVVGKGIFTGVATLTSTGALATAGQCIYKGIVALTGSGTLSGKGALLIIGKATLIGTGVLSAVGRLLLYAKVTLTGGGSLSAILISVLRILTIKATLASWLVCEATQRKGLILEVTKMKIFDIGETVICSIEIKDGDGNFKDPSGDTQHMTITIIDKNNKTVIDNAKMDSNATGKYCYDFQTLGCLDGKYTVSYKAVDNTRITIEKYTFALN